MAAVSGGLRLGVCAAKNSVQPGSPLFLPQSVFGPPAVSGNLHVLVDVNRWGINGAEIALDPEPLVCKVDYGSVDADSARAVDRRLKSQQAGAETQFPAIVAAASVKKLRLW